MGTVGEGFASRVLEIDAGERFLVFLAASAEELPDDAALREIRLEYRMSQPDRGVATDLFVAAWTGIVGSLAYEPVGAAVRHVAAYVRSLGARRAVGDVTQVVARLEAAYEAAVRRPSGGLADAEIRRLPDGSWAAGFTSGGVRVLALLDATGSVVEWTQTREPAAAPPAVSAPAQPPETGSF